MDPLALGLRSLNAARTKDELVEALWDLRNSANDEPGVCSAFTAKVVLQGLAYEMEQTLADNDGEMPVQVFARALRHTLDPRLSGP